MSISAEQHNGRSFSALLKTSLERKLTVQELVPTYLKVSWRASRAMVNEPFPAKIGDICNKKLISFSTACNPPVDETRESAEQGILLINFYS